LSGGELCRESLELEKEQCPLAKLKCQRFLFIKNMEKIQNKKLINEAILKNINDSIAGLKYGQVSVTVHNSKIVQVEVTKKSRFDDTWLIEGGGGI